MEIFKTCGAPAIDEALSPEDLAKHRERAIATEHRMYGYFGPIFSRPMVFEKKGDVVQGHTHNFDHATFVWRGAVLLEAQETGIDGEVVGEPIKRSYEAPAMIVVRKHIRHKFTALEDRSEAYCLYTHRSFDGEVAQSPNGNEAAYV